MRRAVLALHGAIFLLRKSDIDSIACPQHGIAAGILPATRYY